MSRDSSGARPAAPADPAQPVDARVDDLLARMTLEEKVDQLHQGAVGDAGPNNFRARPDVFRPTYGSFILNGPEDRVLRDELQRMCLEESRLGIPAIFGADVIHGYRTIFPIPLAQACTWTPELVRRAGRAAAREARVAGIDWTFAPMLDWCVDPRWGRIAETFGESPRAAAVFGAAAVRGYQGERLDEAGSIAACLKHFIGYGASEGGRDYAFTDVSEQRLWEMHLPAFVAGIEAGARTVMSAFNDLCGIPASANRHTLTGILRERLGFGGFVVSDWNAVWQCEQQGFSADGAEAAAAAITAGVDMNMADGLFRAHLPELVRAGRVSTGVLDGAVRRILRVKFELGLFEHPFAGRDTVLPAAAMDEHASLTEEMAAQSMVLLANHRSVLPLGPDVRDVAVIGPLADDRAALLGAWAGQGRPDEVVTIHEGLRRRAGRALAVRTAPGCPIEGGTREGFARALELARAAQLVVLCLGESAQMSGENAARSSLRLPGHQAALAMEIARTGRPVVLVLVSGRPLELGPLAREMAAILAAWQPGTRGGFAVADLLLGRREPSGRLAVTWPHTTGQVPLYHNMRPRARPGREGAHQDVEDGPLYPFGHGLGFTDFEYGPIRLGSGVVRVDATLVAEVDVANTGTRDGTETVFWFVRDPAASITRPLRELRLFEKALIPAGASRTFRFEIIPARDLTFPDASGRPVLEAGTIILMAGPQTVQFLVQA